MTRSKAIVEFKSVPEIYKKEKSGKKRNICRYFNSIEPKYIMLREGNATHIKITKKGGNASEECFTRKIKDVTYWKRLVIISW